jgi:hypothetical protein
MEAHAAVRRALGITDKDGEATEEAVTSEISITRFGEVLREFAQLFVYLGCHSSRNGPDVACGAESQSFL